MPRVKNSNLWFQQALDVAKDPNASDWLKNSLTDAINLNPEVVAAEVDTLRRILKLREAAVKHSAPITQTSNKSLKLVS